MAYTVAKILHIRPLTVLTEWNCEELLVTFGVYMNELMDEKYAEYQTLDSTAKSKVEIKPKEYALRFVTFEQLEQANKPKSEEQIAFEEQERLQIEAFMKGGGIIG